MEINLTEKEKEAVSRSCLALDVPTVKDALDLVGLLSDYVGIFKVGKELHAAAGIEGINIIGEIENRGGNTFLDLKLHDTPNTVYKTSKAITVPGVYMFNVHVAGGEKMCKEAIRGAYEAFGSGKGGKKIPRVIGVTVLTSLSDEDLAEQGLGIKYDDLVRRRTELAKKWGLAGVVCPANKAGALEKEFGSDLLYVTPGIEWGGKKGDGQKQLYTPDLAVRDCSNSILVLGSAITKAENKREAAYEIIKAMAEYL